MTAASGGVQRLAEVAVGILENGRTGSDSLVVDDIEFKGVWVAAKDAAGCGNVLLCFG